DPSNFILGTGAISKHTGRLLKEAIDKGASKATLQRILKLPNKVLEPLKKVSEKAKILNNPTDGLRKFLQKQDSYLTNQAVKRNIIIDDFVKTTKKIPDPETIVKVRKIGNGQIKIT